LKRVGFWRAQSSLARQFDFNKENTMCLIQMFSLLLWAFTWTATATPAAPVDSQSASAAAFDHLKQLAGDWESTSSKEGVSRLRYTLTANGSALQEQFTGKPGEMLTVYTLDGDRILMTHYCVAHNQPRMAAKNLDPATGDFHFDFVDLAGAPSDSIGHMHSMTIHIVDADHIQTNWFFYENGKAKFTEASYYTRVR
jgi:hypothetical protein